jgi:hypothetical protein
LQPWSGLTTGEVVDDLRAWLAGGESKEDYAQMFDLKGLFLHLQDMWGMLELVKGA